MAKAGKTKGGSAMSGGVGDAEKWANKQADGSNAPILGGIAKEHVDQLAGAGKSISGIANGNYKEFGRGTAQFAKGIAGSLTGGIFGMNKAPDPTYIGGSAEALDARRQQQAQGIGQGQAYTAGGMDTSAVGAQMLGGAYDQAGMDRARATGFATAGMGIGGQGIAGQQAALGRQNAMLGNLVNTAQQQGPSAAQAQMQMGLDQSQNAMMAQAAAARGGNAASAMRTAQANGAQLAGQVNQQAAMLRAQEAQQHQANVMNAQQIAAGAYGGQQAQAGQTAQLGYGMAGQGLGLSQGSTGQQGQMGASVGSIGLGQAQAGNQMQGNYLGAQTSADNAQLDADTKQSSAKQASKGGIMGAAGKLIGSIFG